MNRLIICIILLMSILTGCGKNNPPDGYIILYNNVERWAYAIQTESGYSKSLLSYSSKRKATKEAWASSKWRKEKIDSDNWHEYKENKK